LFDTPTLIIKSFYAQNYIKPLTDPVFQRYLINSLIIATSNALLVTILACWRPMRSRAGSCPVRTTSSSGRSRSAWPRPPRLFCRSSCSSRGVFKIGDWMMFDTHIGLILLYCVFNLPFAVWLMKGIMDGMPIELDEAAFVDGANALDGADAHHRPLVAPGLAITFILSWIFAWNEYLFAANLTSVNARTITTGLAEFVSVTGTNWGEMAAVATISILPALIFLVFVQRYIVTGLTFGAVKE
jgi:ABC-type glycerol-3-phosphate transport system permease component